MNYSKAIISGVDISDMNRCGVEGILKGAPFQTTSSCHEMIAKEYKIQLEARDHLIGFRPKEKTKGNTAVSQYAVNALEIKLQTICMTYNQLSFID